MTDNTVLPAGVGGDSIRDIDRAGVKTQVNQIDVGGATSESLLVRGQQTMANSLPVTLASNQSSIPVTLPSTVSTANSTAVTLGISGVYTGTSEDVSSFTTVTVNVFTDVASATDGLQLQQSSNGTNWDNADSYTIPAATGKTFKTDVNSKFFRIVYTNGGTAQATFRLQTIYSSVGHMGSSIRPQDGRSLQNDVREVVAYGGLFNGTTLDLARGTIANGQLVDVSRGAAPLIGTGSLTAAAQTVTLALGGRYANTSFSVAGTWAGTLTFEASNDDFATLTTINALRAGDNSISQNVATGNVNNDIYRCATAAFKSVRLNATALTSGSANITAYASEQASGVFLNFPIPAGANNIGSVAQSGTWVSSTATTTAAPTYTTGTNNPLSTTVGGALRTQIDNSPTVFLAAGTNSVGTVQQATLTKGTQGSTGVTVQALNDAGRNLVTYYTVIPVLATATDTLQSLTGTKSGATVTATTTPAVVTTGKTLRITRLSATYIATATSGYAIARLRFNTGGVVAITSPVAGTLAVAAGTPSTANSGSSEDASIAEGKEFAAGTGIGISVQGFAAATATAVGYMFVSVSGYEY